MLLDFPATEYNEDNINCGDVVWVHFHSSKHQIEDDLIVLRVPQNNDYWLFKGKNTGDIFRISEPCTVGKTQRAGSSV